MNLCAVASHLYIVKDGNVSVTYRGNDDTSRQAYNLGVITRGECFGEKSMLTGSPLWGTFGCRCV